MRAIYQARRRPGRERTTAPVVNPPACKETQRRVLSTARKRTYVTHARVTMVKRRKGTYARRNDWGGFSYYFEESSVAVIPMIVSEKSARRFFPSISKREKTYAGKERNGRTVSKVGRRRKGEVEPVRPALESR